MGKNYSEKNDETRRIVDNTYCILLKMDEIYNKLVINYFNFNQFRVIQLRLWRVNLLFIIVIKP